MFYLTLIFYIKYILYMCIRLLGHIQQYIIEHTNRQAYQCIHLIYAGRNQHKERTSPSPTKQPTKPFCGVDIDMNRRDVLS